MNGWTLTRVWQIDHTLVVAKTIEDAVALFKTYMGKEFRGEPKKVRAIGSDNYIVDYDALIKEETNTTKVKDVDLEKEILSYIQDNTSNGDFRADTYEDTYDMAEHFFELGLKAKGENNPYKE